MNRIIEEDIRTILEDTPCLSVLRGKTVLISGAGGFLPAYMVETLLSLNFRDPGFDVHVIAMVRNKEKASRRFHHLLGTPHLEIVENDVCLPFEPARKVDYIVHAASQASPKYYGSDPVGTLNANLTGTINLISLAHRHSVESFLYFSSSEVYGEVTDIQIPTQETMFGYLDPAQVRSCYAESKRMGETICMSWFHQYGVPAKVVRPFHTYGPGMALDDGRVFSDFVSDVVHHRNIVLHSDGRARRAFCYLADATKAFLTVLLKGEAGKSYNVGNPHEEYSISELAELIVSLELGLVVERKQNVNNGYIASTTSRISPNIARMEELGWKPVVDAKTGFKRTIDSFLAS